MEGEESEIVSLNNDNIFDTMDSGEGISFPSTSRRSNQLMMGSKGSKGTGLNSSGFYSTSCYSSTGGEEEEEEEEEEERHIREEESLYSNATSSLQSGTQDGGSGIRGIGETGGIWGKEVIRGIRGKRSIKPPLAPTPTPAFAATGRNNSVVSTSKHTNTSKKRYNIVGVGYRKRKVVGSR